MQLTFDVDLTDTQDMLKDYFGIDLPQTELMKLLATKGKFYLLGEILDGSETDTCVREQIIDTVCKAAGADSWPTYGDKSNLEEYYAHLSEKLKSINGVMVS